VQHLLLLGRGHKATTRMLLRRQIVIIDVLPLRLLTFEILRQRISYSRTLKVVAVTVARPRVKYSERQFQESVLCSVPT
jgi:hypothetical protein